MGAHLWEEACRKLRKGCITQGSLRWLALVLCEVRWTFCDLEDFVVVFLRKMSKKFGLAGKVAPRWR